MNNCQAKKILGALLATMAAVLFLVSLKLPLWQMHLEAPQYRDEEALNIAVYPREFRGDLGELAVLNQYIGVHVPKVLPQFKWLPIVLMSAAGLTFVAMFLSRRLRARAQVFVVATVLLALLIGAGQALAQMHDIGHKRDQKTILTGVKDFTPPFLGTTKIAQFTVSSQLGAGAWLIGAAMALQLSAAWLNRNVGKKLQPRTRVASETDSDADSVTREPCATLS